MEIAEPVLEESGVLDRTNLFLSISTLFLAFFLFYPTTLVRFPILFYEFCTLSSLE